MTVNKVLAANREKLMEILRENFTGDPKTSWENILDNVADWFESYCDDEASGFLSNQFESGLLNADDLIGEFDQWLSFGGIEDINEFDII